jgi:hypothetical protein
MNSSGRQVAAMNWKCIRLELASTHEFPAGSVGRAYLIRVPLDDSDVIDRAALSESPSRATVRRHWSAEPDESGVLEQSDSDCIMRSGGHRRVLHFNGTPVRLGQTVAVSEADGTILPFKVASVR